jgi:cytochrome c oxidase accessory protein FixG
MNNEPDSHDSYRDSLATADQQGRRIWVYPNKPSGRFYSARKLVSYFLLAFLFLAPFLKLNGHQLLQFDIIERKFFIFGLAFWPQDMHLFVLIGITLVVFIVLFTAVFGRLFCGWACPQTIFMEMVFRRIEYLIEGNGPRQRALNKAPWDGTKILKKTIKHLIFYAISFLIGNTFLAYIIGADDLIKIITDPPNQHVTGLIIMILFSFVFYWIFAYFREQVCTMVCPYGRLQGVLLDDNSIVVAYDHKRGEKRGPVERGQSFDERGHCIDCAACVHVCPTEIDIRNGTQLECINCTACIDACDRVMDRMRLPRGLIRYSSGVAIEKKQAFRFTPRIIIYTIALLVLTGAVFGLTFMRNEIETTVLRTPGTLYEQVDDDIIRNLYSIRIVNKTYDELPIEIRLKQPEGKVEIVGGNLTVEPNGLAETVFFVEIEKKILFSANSIIVLEIYTGEKLLETIHTSFMGPAYERHERERDEDND